MNAKVLQVENVEAGYGKKQVLFDLSLYVQEGEIVSLIGPNGSGKSTMLKTVCGLISPWSGRISFNGTTINGLSPAENVDRGITFSPQNNNVFRDLTVMENLEVGGIRLLRNEVRDRIVQVLDFFPALKGRLRQDAGTLSGGEQQMLALARALIPRPKLLMLDEPSLGLSPNLVRMVFERIAAITRETAVSVLIVEQKVREVFDISDRVYSLKLGKIAFEGLPKELQDDRRKLKELFL